LRYDYFGIVQEKHGNFINFDPDYREDIAVANAASINRTTTTGRRVSLLRGT